MLGCHQQCIAEFAPENQEAAFVYADCMSEGKEVRAFLQRFNVPEKRFRARAMSRIAERARLGLLWDLLGTVPGDRSRFMADLLLVE